MCENEKTAIMFNGNSISYKMLSDEVAKRERYLSYLDITQGIVGLLFRRNIEYVYWMLAILKAGYCLLPLEPYVIKEKLMYIIKDAGLNTILSDTNMEIEIKNCINVTGLNIDCNGHTHLNQNEKNLAYIIYTSGSTGLPKGVMISRKSLHNFLHNFLPDAIQKDDVFLANTAYTFDISFVELLLPLVRRTTIYMTTEEEQKNPRILARLLKEKKIDWVQFTPSCLTMLLQYKKNLSALSDVGNILIGGEKVPGALAKLLKKTLKGKLYNVYGPTEATIWTHIGNLKDDFVNVGYAIEGVKEYILDENMNEAQQGILWLAGDELAEGYINNVELTRDKFVCWKGEKIYNTGDIVTKADGKLIILGRKDNQIKISGKRIELEEIETIITDAIGAVPCIVCEILGDLCIVITDQRITLDKIMKKAGYRIPVEFLPKRIEYIDYIPLTQNGKTDRKRVKEIVMQKKQWTEKALSILKEFTIGELSGDISMKDLGISSIEYVTLIVKIEKAFDIEFEDSALVMTYFEKVDNFIEYIGSLIDREMK